MCTCDASHALCPSLAFCSSAHSTRPPRNWPRDFTLFPLASNWWLPSQCRSLDPPSGPLVVHLAAHGGERQVKERQRESAHTHASGCSACATDASAVQVHARCGTPELGEYPLVEQQRHSASGTVLQFGPVAAGSLDGVDGQAQAGHVIEDLRKSGRAKRRRWAFGTGQGLGFGSPRSKAKRTLCRPRGT